MPQHNKTSSPSEQMVNTGKQSQPLKQPSKEALDMAARLLLKMAQKKTPGKG